ncbi:hypothetical protein [Pontibacter sp. G13]|uniref:hypothetical protein n=1 Tax=Pontibacter sp. G13 TaxID=3074898 RepID=UPI00288A2623|nr:hypothetical protein [Pontibacter sp. G13]WNJ17495.1 hypothetical protein RJD25_21820 [Pontibacter sp. G13]
MRNHLPNPFTLKNTFLFLVLSTLLISCSVDTEQHENPKDAAKTFVEQYLKGDYEAVYENASVEMKSFVSQELFLTASKLQDKIYGKMTQAELEAELAGKYNISPTYIFRYKTTNEAGREFIMMSEFLNGHLLKNTVEEPDWRPESAFTQELVAPIAKLIDESKYEEIYTLLGEKYPLPQVEDAFEQIKEMRGDAQHQYCTTWTENDQKGGLLLEVSYGYAGKGYMRYQFEVGESEFPFAGAFFNPDSTVTFPAAE